MRHPLSCAATLTELQGFGSSIFIIADPDPDPGLFFKGNLYTWNRILILNADPDTAIKIMRIRIRNSAVSSLLFKSGMPNCLAFCHTGSGMKKNTPAGFAPVRNRNKRTRFGAGMLRHRTVMLGMPTVSSSMPMSSYA
jgi:hypothetical protein